MDDDDDEDVVDVVVVVFLLKYVKLNFEGALFYVIHVDAVCCSNRSLQISIVVLVFLFIHAYLRSRNKLRLSNNILK